MRLAQCDQTKVAEYFQQNDPPEIVNQSVDNLIYNFNRTVIQILKENKATAHQEPSEWGNAEKWKKLLEENDPKKIWKSIGWNGTVETSCSMLPSDEEFRIHFESLLNPEKGENSCEIEVRELPSIPILDDPITPVEVVEAADKCKESKSFIGVTPAILSSLPAVWILFITQILNLVFCNEQLAYPVLWCYNKLVVLFKKGARLSYDSEVSWPSVALETVRCQP